MIRSVIALLIGAPAGAAPLSLDAARWAELVAIHAAVAALPAVTDAARFGRDEVWMPAGAAGGDCEDKALAARDRLRDRGWPADALGLALAFTEAGEYHAVLAVEVLIAGRPATYVVDNRFAAPLGWDALSRRGYRWTIRQTADGWVRVMP